LKTNGARKKTLFLFCSVTFQKNTQKAPTNSPAIADGGVQKKTGFYGLFSYV
jgi:hypothetical protein